MVIGTTDSSYRRTSLNSVGRAVGGPPGGVKMGEEASVRLDVTRTTAPFCGETLTSQWRVM